MARCGCGGACSCALVAGDNTTVTGSGTPANPWKVNAVTNCDEVRDCFTSGNGTTYDPSDGSFDVCISPNTPNALTRDANGCLIVAPGAATVTTGCGLEGTGTPADPVRANTQTWPFACDLEDQGSGVYCGTDGQLYSDPPGAISFYSDSDNEELPGTGIAVPAAADTVIRTYTLDVTNTDPCRTATAFIWQDVDCDFILPVGAEGAYGIDGDDTFDLTNEGTATTFDNHAQSGKMRRITVAPGATTTITMNITAGLGRNGARINRIQHALRVWLVTVS